MVGSELRLRRQRAGLTGFLICLHSGIGRSRLSDIERGYVEPRESEIQRIEAAIKKLARVKAKVAKFAAEVGLPM